jgi:hypothetical protein
MNGSTQLDVIQRLGRSRAIVLAMRIAGQLETVLRSAM